MKNCFGSILSTTLILFVLFALDLWFFFLEGRQLTFFVLALFIAFLFSPQNRTGTIIGCSLLLLCESLVINSSLWLPLVYALPAAVIITILRPHIYPHALYPSLASGLFIVIFQLAFSPALLADYGYTIWLVFGTMITTLLFSLKLKTGKMRQSLTIST